MTAKTILKAQVAGSVFVGLLYGLTSLTRPFFPLPGNYGYNDHELKYLDNIWSKLVEPFWGNFIDTKVDEVIIAGWNVLGALVKTPLVDREAYRANLLLNQVLLDGSVARARTPTAKQEVVSKVLAATVQPEQLPGWSARWIVSRTEGLLGKFSYCLENLKEGMVGVDWKCTEEGTRIMPVRSSIPLCSRFRSDDVVTRWRYTTSGSTS